MSMFPHTVTVYNVGRDVDLSTMEETLINHITVLRGVLLDASKGTNVTKSGLEGADAVNLYIPADVSAVDGVTGTPRKYVGPVDFWAADVLKTLICFIYGFIIFLSFFPTTKPPF